MQYRVISEREGDLRACLVLAGLRENFPHASSDALICPESCLGGTTQVVNLVTRRQLFLIWDEGDTQLIQRALLRDAAAVIGHRSVDEFTEGVLALERGVGIFIPPTLLRQVAQSGSNLAEFGQTRKEIDLTSREKEVLEQLGKGYSNPEIASALSISIHTVRCHLTSLSSKFRITGRNKLVASARDLGFLK